MHKQVDIGAHVAHAPVDKAKEPELCSGIQDVCGHVFHAVYVPCSILLNQWADRFYFSHIMPLTIQNLYIRELRHM